jgi:hypothetical protein
MGPGECADDAQLRLQPGRRPAAEYTTFNSGQSHALLGPTPPTWTPVTSGACARNQAAVHVGSDL